MKTVLFLLTSISLLAQPVDLEKLDRLLAESANFTPGANSSPLRDIDNIVATIADSATRQAVEERLLLALPKAQTAAAKGHICRQLYYVGGSKSIAPLAALLADAEIADVARRSLAVIPDAEAGDALLNAMPTLDTQGQIGVIIALGDRKHEPARAALGALLASANSAKVAAAASALGQLGGAKAVEALQAANANGVAGRSIHTALLRCAESLDAAAARVIYEQFYAVDQPSHLRAAGLRGLARVADDPGTLLTKAIQGKDAKLASHAIRIVADSDGNVGPLLELLPTLTPPTQALLIRALSERGDSTLSAAIVPFVGAEDENVKSAAIEALGKIGDAGAMQSLLSAAVTEDGAIRNIARASLENLPVKDEQLLRAMDFNNSASQEELIRALSARRASVATPKLIAVAASADDKGLRREALRGLRKLVQPAHLPQLFERVAAPKEESDRGAWVDAISDGVERLPDLDARARTLMAALITASPEIQNVLLPLLAKSATPGALSTVREAVKSEDKQIRDGGIRALSKWPNDDAAKDLLQIITGAEDEKHRVLATRGYLDIARGHEDSEGMYQRALAFAENNADRKHILSGLGSANSLSAFKLVADYLANGALAREAALALVQIGDALPVANSADVRPVMQRIMAEVDDEAIAKKAQAVTLKYEEFDDFILEWEGAGPFTADSYKKACDTDFEYSDADWKPVTKGMDKGMLNCETTFGGGSSRVAYLRGSVTMAADADAQLELGSDDGIKLWLNGELVREFTGNRGTSRGNDKVKVKLKAGKNEVLAKVINDGGGWGFCCRFRDPNGASLKGMSLE